MTHRRNREASARSLVAFLALLTAASASADLAVVPTDHATIQAAVDAVQGTADALVRIDSDATFVGRVTVNQSVRIEAGAGFRPTLQGEATSCVLAGPCTIELHPTAGARTFRLRGLRFIPPAGQAPGSGGRHVLLLNESTESATLDVFDLELVDPEGATFAGIVSRVVPNSPASNFVSVDGTRIEVRGPPPHSASAIEMGERGLLSLLDSDLSLSGPTGNLLGFFGDQEAFVLGARLAVDAPATPHHAGVALFLGDSAATFSGDRIELRDEGEGTVGGILVVPQSGGEGSLLLDSTRFAGDGNGGGFAVTVQPFPGNLARITAVNNEIRGLDGAVRLSAQGGTVEAVVTNNTVHASNEDAVRITAFDGGAIEVAIFNNLFTRTGGAGIEVDFLDGTLAGELGFNGYFENAGGAVDPLLAPGSSGDRFADPRYAGEYDLRLLSGSPMIDAAWDSAPELPKDDIDGVDRPVGGGFDIGAHEGGVQISVLEVPALDRVGALLLAAALAGFAIRRLRAARAVRGAGSRFSAGG